jgi:hypothetical protein
MTSFSFQTKGKKNKNKEKKTIEKKINAEKGGSFPSNLHSAFSLLVPTFALLFQFKHFLLASSSSQAKNKIK